MFQEIRRIIIIIGDLLRVTDSVLSVVDYVFLFIYPTPPMRIVGEALIFINTHSYISIWVDGGGGE